MTDVAIWQPQSAEVATFEPTGPLDDWIRVADQVVRLAEVICMTPFVPDGLRGNAPATAAAILTGRELNIPPMTALANIHVIHGKPGLSALVMRALVLSKGHEWQDVDVSNTRVIVRGRRKGTAEWTTASFSVSDAQTAKLQLGGYPQDKLYARATARLARRAFADVIAGMPYSIEELEDGITEDEPVTLVPAGDAAKPPAPRTAQRKPRAQASPPAQAAAPPAAAPAQMTGAGGDLPPLPGEDEPDASDYDTPGTVSPQQLTKIWTVLSSVYLFGSDEKDAARGVCAQILRSDLASSKDLSYNGAKTVIDTLSHWEAQAKAQDEEPRGYLLVMLEALKDGEVPGE